MVIKSRRPVCMTFAFLTLIAIVLIVISLVLPQLISCVQLIFSELPGFIDELIEQMAALNVLPENTMETLSEEDWDSRMGHP